MFNPKIKLGDFLTTNELSNIFICGNMGEMRRSRSTNTLVLISDYTKGLYEDKWFGDTLHYTGMGKKGDQDMIQYNDSYHLIFPSWGNIF